MFPVVVSYNPECDLLVHCQQTGTACSAAVCREQSSTEMESHDTMTEMLGRCAICQQAALGVQAVNGQLVQEPENTDAGCCGKALEDYQNLSYKRWCPDFG